MDKCVPIQWGHLCALVIRDLLSQVMDVTVLVSYRHTSVGNHITEQELEDIIMHCDFRY